MSGEIPPELGNLANLTQLFLAENQLNGEIPPELGNLANLQGLLLHGNQLSGGIPPELGNLANLERVWLHGNQLSGEIPPESGQPAQPEIAGPQGEPVERMRAKQFVGPVEHGFFKPGWSPVLPVRPRLTQPIA